MLCVAPKWQAELALEGVHSRAKLAYHRIPQEVRNVVVRKGAPEDGTTTAMRPLPGGARMYPETDIPTTPIDPAHWEKIRSNLPPSREERLSRLSTTELSDNQILLLLCRPFKQLIVLPPQLLFELLTHPIHHFALFLEK